MPPLIVAHRCLSPENKLSGFKKAAKAGYAAVELDVRLSKDGVPVVIHDESIDRTTGGSGLVAELTHKQLARWRVPTLLSLLQLASQEEYKHVRRIFIEVKHVGPQQTTQLVEKVVGVVRRLGLLQRCGIISFDADAIALSKRLEPRIKTGLICGGHVECDGVDADMLWLHHSVFLFLSQQRNNFKNKDKEVFVWTVNDNLTLSRLPKSKIKGIVTDGIYCAPP